jgi:DNA-binding GntR family transcriptional regulator
MSSIALQPLAAPMTLRGAVAEHLRTAIVAGELAPGELLKEVDLADRMRVSATPIREALVELAGEGLVEIEPNRLKRVAPLDPEATFDLVQVQTALWRMAYVAAFPHVGATDFESLERALQDYQSSLAEGNTLAAIRAGHAFHTVFVEASRNRELLRVTLDRRSLIARFILLRGAESISAAGLKQHRSILKAARRGDTAEVLAALDKLASKLMELARRELPAAARSTRR